eukprot:TRINITY_DN3882_c0_g1_i10.p1 TRINITY_DN3882_c0_g1~~TRINITY_DN3882_c0_g1_i10.p1  ORF type:complete len:222 (+),score=-17.38 TRINITY_DN3882_c0_g1_i10:556-1221(+)
MKTVCQESKYLYIQLYVVSTSISAEIAADYTRILWEIFLSLIQYVRLLLFISLLLATLYFRKYSNMYRKIDNKLNSIKLYIKMVFLVWKLQLGYYYIHIHHLPISIQILVTQGNCIYQKLVIFLLCCAVFALLILILLTQLIFNQKFYWSREFFDNITIDIVVRQFQQGILVKFGHVWNGLVIFIGLFGILCILVLFDIIRFDFQWRLQSRICYCCWYPTR